MIIIYAKCRSFYEINIKISIMLLPLTRVKRIIKEEPEVLGCGPESTFLIGLASVNIHIFFTYFYLYWIQYIYIFKYVVYYFNLQF